ncbi:uncharacterized protein S101395_03862 [Bacillus sonorensis]|uniref:Protein YhcO n=2 Tax=Bacillus sonorensis TaxID=119858 RepID=M5P784_9BACI|nr:uncharacterized protein S101395_03862 [Bacillus sonorensis]EME75861.1 protein YhcO [Bacillus sonorensis L12]TWK72574.1 hypothetical protein CHCC20335_1239 [Bacillus paralicheniformis]
MGKHIKAALVIMAAGMLAAAVWHVFFHQDQASRIAVTAGSAEKRELLKTKNMTRHQHASIYYSDQEKPILELTKETLTYADDLNRAIFGQSRFHGIDLVFFSNSKEIEAFSKLSDITGFYSEETRIIGLLPEDREQLFNNDGFAVFLYKRVLIHEYTHYAFHEKLRELGSEPEDYPLWFHEGVAEWSTAHDSAYTRTLPSVVPLAKLKTDRQWQKMRDDSESDIYLQSFYMIDELVNKKGRGIILDIMKETAEAKNFKKGFRAAVHQELTEFEKEFKQKYEKTALRVPMPFFFINESVPAVRLPCSAAFAFVPGQVHRRKAFFACPAERAEEPGNSRVCFDKETLHRPFQYSEEFDPPALFGRPDLSPQEPPLRGRKCMI